MSLIVVNRAPNRRLRLRMPRLLLDRAGKAPLPFHMLPASRRRMSVGPPEEREKGEHATH